MARQQGVFAGLPRVAYRRAPDRYFTLVAVAVVLHGVAVAVFGTAMLLLYVNLSAKETAAFAACSVAGYVIEGIAAAIVFKAHKRPADPWAGAAQLPVQLLRSPGLPVLGAAGAVASALLLTDILHLPARDAWLLLPLSGLLYLSSLVLRYLGLELAMRPVLEALGQAPPTITEHVSLHRRLVATVPTVTWASGVIVGGLLTDNTRRLYTIGLASLIALGVTAVVSTWLSLVLADAVSGPIENLRDATSRVAAGDLSVRVPVVSTDEIGQLAASFNTMVAGLGERERLREAFGAFVDPALTERVLAEGSELTGEEVEVSVLFVDVRDFTAFAESAPAPDVVTALNTLYDLIVPVVIAHGGHANRFLGDGLLAVFGAPERHADHAARAVDAALEITKLSRQHTLRVGIGVNSGQVVAGTIGGGDRRDFTVIGDVVNTAARVEAATRLTGDDLLITDATLQALGAERQGCFAERPTAPLPGKSEPVRLFRALTDEPE